eukprot:scaffold91660_cov48-Attheya_sp.AAC.1
MSMDSQGHCQGFSVETNGCVYGCSLSIYKVEAGGPKGVQVVEQLDYSDSVNIQPGSLVHLSLSLSLLYLLPIGASVCLLSLPLSLLMFHAASGMARRCAQSMRLVLPVGTLVFSLKSETFLQSCPLFSTPSVSHQVAYCWAYSMRLVLVVRTLIRGDKDVEAAECGGHDERCNLGMPMGFLGAGAVAMDKQELGWNVVDIGIAVGHSIIFGDVVFFN